jgi:hypothetical protein
VTLSAKPSQDASQRATLSVRPGWFVTLVILSCLLAGAAIFGLLRSMRF